MNSSSAPLVSHLAIVPPLSDARRADLARIIAVLESAATCGDPIGHELRQACAAAALELRWLGRLAAKERPATAFSPPRRYRRLAATRRPAAVEDSESR